MKAFISLLILLGFTTQSYAALTIEQERCFVKTQIPLAQYQGANQKLKYTEAVEMIAQEIQAMNDEGGFDFYGFTNSTDAAANMIKVGEMATTIQTELNSIDLTARGTRAYNQAIGQTTLNGFLSAAGEAATSAIPTGFFLFFGGLAQVPGVKVLEKFSGSFMWGRVYVPMLVTLSPKNTSEGVCERLFTEEYKLHEEGVKLEYTELSKARIFIPVGDVNLRTDAKLGFRRGLGVFWGEVNTAEDFTGAVGAFSLSTKFANATTGAGKALAAIGNKLNIKLGTVVNGSVNFSGASVERVFPMITFGGDNVFSARDTATNIRKTPKARVNTGYIFTSAAIEANTEMQTNGERCLAALGLTETLDAEEEASADEETTAAENVVDVAANLVEERTAYLKRLCGSVDPAKAE